MTDSLHEGLRALLGSAVSGARGEGFDTVLTVEQASLRETLERLKTDGFNMLVDLTCVDHLGFGKSVDSRATPSHPEPPPRERPAFPARFKLVYRLMDLDPGTGLARRRVALESWVLDAGKDLSARGLWPNADWLEREVWDMFGVSWEDRPDIRRILMYEEFQGHPLRKDYPIDRRQPLIGPKEGSSRKPLPPEPRPRVP